MSNIGMSQKTKNKLVEVIIVGKHFENDMERTFFVEIDEAIKKKTKFNIEKQTGKKTSDGMILEYCKHLVTKGEYLTTFYNPNKHDNNNIFNHVIVPVKGDGLVCGCDWLELEEI